MNLLPIVEITMDKGRTAFVHLEPVDGIHLVFQQFSIAPDRPLVGVYLSFPWE